MPKTGRPKEYSEDEVLDLLPPEGMTCTEWQVEAGKECGIKERKFFDLRKSLQDQHKIIRSKITKRWQPIKK